MCTFVFAETLRSPQGSSNHFSDFMLSYMIQHIDWLYVVSDINLKHWILETSQKQLNSSIYVRQMAQHVRWAMFAQLCQVACVSLTLFLSGWHSKLARESRSQTLMLSQLRENWAIRRKWIEELGCFLMVPKIKDFWEQFLSIISSFCL